ncbi:MAG: transcription antitermination factor NusB [Acidaminococcus sp.]|nr:transcription antitermination factor NusB [Acidaminococcus sp.]
MSRREARTIALRSLFALDFNPDQPLEETVQFMAAEDDIQDAHENDLAYALSLVQGVTTHKEALDKELDTLNPDWKVTRMNGIDRNLLRIADFEIYYAEEKVPAPVAINEAVELAKVYGGDESPAFVNGLLGSLVKKHAQ